MNKAAIIGIIVAVIAIGILAALSFNSFSILQDNSNKSPILGNEEEENSKPQGRDLTIEFDEKMGFSAP